MDDLSIYRAVTAARVLAERGFAIGAAANMAAHRFCCNPWHVHALAAEAIAGLAMARLELANKPQKEVLHD